MRPTCSDRAPCSPWASCTASCCLSCRQRASSDFLPRLSQRAHLGRCRRSRAGGWAAAAALAAGGGGRGAGRHRSVRGQNSSTIAEGFSSTSVPAEAWASCEYGRRDETCPVSTGGRDEACPVSTGGRGGSGGVLFDVRACGGVGVTSRAGAGPSASGHWTVPREREKRVHILRALLNPPIRRLTSLRQAVVRGHSWRTVQARTPRFRGVMEAGRTWRGRVNSQGEGRGLAPSTAGSKRCVCEYGRRDETCPVSTGGGTRRVQSVREGGEGGGGGGRLRGAVA
jgi:hypothetical protein